MPNRVNDVSLIETRPMIVALTGRSKASLSVSGQMQNDASRLRGTYACSYTCVVIKWRAARSASTVLHDEVDSVVAH